MSEEAKRPRWLVCGATVQGVSHERAGRPNQDAIRWHVADEGQPFAVVVAADGHGNARHFRSGHGAEFATEAASRVLCELGAAIGATSPLSAFAGLTEIDLPRQVVHLWQEAVARHHRDHPFAEDEMAVLAAGDQAAIQQAPDLAYGSTILGVLLAERFGVYLQLGDGDIFSVSVAGEVTRPFAEAEPRLGDETESLCSIGRRSRRTPGGAVGPWGEVRSRLVSFSGGPPALTIVSTDGYAKSFTSEAGFLQVAPDLLELIGSRGFEAVAGQLEDWLREATVAGSGDDISVGLMFWDSGKTAGGGV